ncbi:hypothetical protein K439DRAFT_657368 [Ramaria rubella]|nr:hypothetical protein K439DRAFT_657368 [Ramaria rubella]
MASSYKRNPKFLCINMSSERSSASSHLFHNTLSSSHYTTSISSCRPTLLPPPPVSKPLRLYLSTRARHNVLTAAGAVPMLLVRCFVVLHVPFVLTYGSDCPFNPVRTVQITASCIVLTSFHHCRIRSTRVDRQLLLGFGRSILVRVSV